jgi:hypothetical protein
MASQSMEILLEETNELFTKGNSQTLTKLDNNVLAFMKSYHQYLFVKSDGQENMFVGFRR